MKTYEFDAILQRNKRMTSGYIEFPYDFKKEFKGKVRVKIKAYLDGIFYHGSLVKMRLPYHIFGLTKDVRKKIGKKPGDTIHIILEEDYEERPISVPEDLLSRLQEAAKVFDIFQRLPFKHKKQFVRSVETAKKEDTRKIRIEKIFEELAEKLSSEENL